MQICRQLAGYSYGQADLVRRAMAKKKADVMASERQHFIDGCGKNGVDKDTAEDIFEEMSGFASYAFNKPHAAAYAYVAYQTAYLKAHYPKEFWAAMLTSIFDNTEKILEYTNECRRLNIKILPPDINKGYSQFVVEGENLRYGMAAIKNVGKNFTEAMCVERAQNGEFKGVFDFCRRMSAKNLNRRVIESLIKVGAFDSFGINRRRLFINLDYILNSINNEKKNTLSGQIGFFDVPDFAQESKEVYTDENNIPQAEDYPDSDKLYFEKFLAGIYFSGHPLDKNIEYVKNISTCNITELTGEYNKVYDNTKQTLVVIVSKYRSHVTKKNETMAFVTVEDLTGTLDMLVFPKVFQESQSILGENAVLIVEGTVSLKDDRANILADKIYDINSEEARHMLKAKTDPKYGLYIRVPSRESAQFKKCCDILSEYQGAIPVYFFLEDGKKYILSPKKYWVRESVDALSKLKLTAGENNVVFKK